MGGKLWKVLDLQSNLFWYHLGREGECVLFSLDGMEFQDSYMASNYASGEGVITSQVLGNLSSLPIPC